MKKFQRHPIWDRHSLSNFLKIIKQLHQTGVIFSIVETIESWGSWTIDRGDNCKWGRAPTKQNSTHIAAILGDLDMKQKSKITWREEHQENLVQWFQLPDRRATSLLLSLRQYLIKFQMFPFLWFGWWFNLRHGA